NGNEINRGQSLFDRTSGTLKKFTLFNVTVSAASRLHLRIPKTKHNHLPLST
ncbi:unnamed protein product, partial [Sphenostylis stenocarpa]